MPRLLNLGPAPYLWARRRPESAPTGRVFNWVRNRSANTAKRNFEGSNQAGLPQPAGCPTRVPPGHTETIRFSVSGPALRYARIRPRTDAGTVISLLELDCRASLPHKSQVWRFVRCRT